MEKLSKLLIDVGLSKNVANVFELLSDGEPRTSRQIDRTVDINQPEVSIALRSLGGFVGVTKQKSPGKGRPIKLYQMSQEQRNKYLKKVISEKQAEINKVVESVEKIRDAVYGGKKGD